MSKTFIIAEAGINHNGSLERAKNMIDSAFEAGADAVKFQTFIAEKVISKYAPKAAYQLRATGPDESQLEMVKKLELPFDNFIQLKQHCDYRGITFLSSPFDLESLVFLQSIGLEIFKIPSGEITNLPYLEKIGGFNKKIILSTGMADLGEIQDALKVLISSGTKKDNITVLHCNTEYPTPFKEVNLTAMITLKKRFDINVGYSDHTLGIEVPIAAVAMGAVVIEKHFTLDRNLPGPDHRVSLEPDELKRMIDAIRNIELAFGDGVKKTTSSEIQNRLIVRKSIVAARRIEKGETFSEINITVKRPGTGISPMRWYEVLGKIAVKHYEEDEPIDVI